MENKLIDKLLDLIANTKDKKVDLEKLQAIIAKQEQETKELTEKLKEKELIETQLKKELDDTKILKEEELKKVETLLKESVQETKEEMLDHQILDGFDGVVETENEFINE